MRSLFSLVCQRRYCESPVTLEVDKSPRRYFFRNQYPCDTGRPFAVDAKIKNLLHNPVDFLVDHQLVLEKLYFCNYSV